jgi:hypothetical protein
MQIRFEDHAGFQRTALLCMGGAAAGALIGPMEAAIAGAAVTMAVLPGAEAKRRRLAACSCAGLWTACFLSGNEWTLMGAGAMLGVAMVLARREADAPAPALWAAVTTTALAALATLLLPAASALAALVPKFVAGASFGLWCAIAAVPIRLSFGDDPIDARLAALRSSLSPELRALAERAAAARRAACAELPANVELRATIDSLALATLEVAARAAELSRSTSPALEDDLQRRFAKLTERAQGTDDKAAKGSYQRAAEALQGQLDHLRNLRRARDRAVARLHEDVANLERARFSLTLLHDPANAAELDLLQARLAPAREAIHEP